MITVIDVARSMGVELSREDAWRIGAAIRDRYKAQNDRLPPKELRPKTSGIGSHCFAVYPESYRPLIERAIRSAGAVRTKQGSLPL